MGTYIATRPPALRPPRPDRIAPARAVGNAYATARISARLIDIDPGHTAHRDLGRERGGSALHIPVGQPPAVASLRFKHVNKFLDPEQKFFADVSIRLRESARLRRQS